MHQPDIIQFPYYQLTPGYNLELSQFTIHGETNSPVNFTTTIIRRCPAISKNLRK